MRDFIGKKINHSYESAEESSSTISDGAPADQSYENLSFGPQQKLHGLILSKINNQSMTEEDQHATIVPQSYIENKIKILLHQERENCSDGSISDQDDRNTVKLMYLEDSCNAVDMKLSMNTSEPVDVQADLSFNGKISGIQSSSNNSTLVSSSTNNVLNESLEILTKENSNMMAYANEKSPDLFDDDEDDEEADCDDQGSSAEKANESTKTDESFTKLNQNDIDVQLLRRMKDSFKGVQPPPSITEFNKSVDYILTQYKQHADKYLFKPGDVVQSTEDNNDEADELKPKRLGLFKDSIDGEQIKQDGWPKVSTLKAHGIHYNTSKAYEKFDEEFWPYVKRFIARETSSSFFADYGISSAKKRNLRLKQLNQSPGNRLSHLARRRTAFSSSALLNNSTKLCNKLMVDMKKSDNRRKNKVKTPKRRTPGKRKTPRSSQKKRALTIANIKPATSESSRRALFLSPDRLPKSETMTTIPTETVRDIRPRRVLFSPAKTVNNRENVQDTFLSSSSTSLKRRRTEDEETSGNSTKLRRMDSIREEDLTPRSLKLMKSQSFCAPSNTAAPLSATSSDVGGKTLYRSTSEMIFANHQPPLQRMTESQRSKLLWAVSQALKAKQITTKHENFKLFGSNLAKIVKKIFLEFNDKTITSNSEKLLKLANKYAFDVIQGRTSDQIYAKEKVRIMNQKNITKLSGYIGPEEFELRKKLMRVQSENSIDSFTSSRLSSQTSINSPSIDGLSQITTRTNSSSKNNDFTTVLRENTAAEIRQRSAQKVASPFNRSQPINLPSSAASKNVLKAKRQISFE